jgi:hypothetical protein
MRDSDAVTRQALAVAMLLAAALTASVNGVAWAWTGAAGAAIVLGGLGGLALVLRMRARWAARELIADGREGVPLDPVARERRRLLAEDTRAALAASVERMLAYATRPSPVARPVFDVRVVAAVADELRSLAAVLRVEPASARGVALAEQLLTWGGSALYGHGVEPLRAELGRVRYLLEQ